MARARASSMVLPRSASKTMPTGGLLCDGNCIRVWMLACRLEEEVGGLPIAHLADSLAMALGGGDVPLAGIDGGEQVGEFPQAAEAEVEGHIEEGCLGGCGIGI